MSSKDTTKRANPVRGASISCSYLATGDRNGVTQDMGNLRNTGTSHLLAISGFHIGLIAWSAYAVARRLSHCVALWCPSGMNDRLLLLVPIVASWMYAIGAGLLFPRCAQLWSLFWYSPDDESDGLPLDMVGLATVLVLS